MRAASKPTKLPRVERTFDGLRNAMFDQLDGLISGTGKPEVANSVSRLAGEIVKSASVQADLMRLSSGKRLRAGPRIAGMAILR